MLHNRIYQSASRFSLHAGFGHDEQVYFSTESNYRSPSICNRVEARLKMRCPGLYYGASSSELLILSWCNIALHDFGIQ